MQYTTNERIKDHLQNYHSESMKNATPNDLLKWWKNVAVRAEKEDDRDEYLNDLTVREVIQKIIDFIDKDQKDSFLKELEIIDNLFKSNTLELKNPFWVGSGPEKKKDWFYYRVPKYVLEDMKEGAKYNDFLKDSIDKE